MADKKSGYIGKITNDGVQHVEAPIKGGKKGKASVKKGSDLRSGK